MNDIRRRQFLGAGLTAALAGAPAVLAQRSPSDKIGIASIGVGTRGHYLLGQFQDIPNAEIRVICDLYEGNIERARKLCTNPNVRVVREWEKAVESPEVDAVVIAAPDFWHAPMVVRAAVLRRLPSFAEEKMPIPYGVPIAVAGILMAPSLPFLT